jgi:hypothetical protein
VAPSKARVGYSTSKGGPKGTGFELPPDGAQWSFPSAAVCWSDGALQNIKFQALSLRVSGVPPEADQVSGKKHVEAET